MGTRLLKLLKVGIVEENWKEDLRETTGSDPVPEERVHSATVQGRVVASLWQNALSMPSRYSKATLLLVMFSLKCCMGFVAGEAIGFTGDQMVLR